MTTDTEALRAQFERQCRGLDMIRAGAKESSKADEQPSGS